MNQIWIIFRLNSINLKTKWEIVTLAWMWMSPWWHSPQQWTLCPNIWHTVNLAMIALEVNSTKSLEKLWPTFWCRTLYSKVFEDLVIQAMHHCLWWRKFLYNQVLVYVFLLNFPAVFSLYFHALSAVFPDTAAGHCICAKEREYIMGPWRYMGGAGHMMCAPKLHCIRLDPFWNIKIYDVRYLKSAQERVFFFCYTMIYDFGLVHWGMILGTLRYIYEGTGSLERPPKTRASDLLVLGVDIDQK